jgi:hypothetical protein
VLPPGIGTSDAKVPKKMLAASRDQKESWLRRGAAGLQAEPVDHRREDVPTDEERQAAGRAQRAPDRRRGGLDGREDHPAELADSEHQPGDDTDHEHDEEQERDEAADIDVGEVDLVG